MAAAERLVELELDPGQPLEYPLVEGEPPRGAAADLERSELAATHLGVGVIPHDSVAAALAAARTSGTPVLATGSIYVVGEVRRALGVA